MVHFSLALTKLSMQTFNVISDDEQPWLDAMKIDTIAKFFTW